MKRSPLERRTGLARTGRLPLFSRRRLDEGDRYRKVVLEVRRRDRGRCQVAARRGMDPRRCWGPVGPHHVRPTGLGGDRCDPGNIILACRACHSWLHDSPVEARQIGVLA